MRNCVPSFLSRINTERKNVYPGYTKKNDNRTKCQQDCPRIELRYHRLAPVHHFHNSSFSSPLQRTTGMETTTPQIKNSIGRKVKNELDARAAHAFELFRAVTFKTTSRYCICGFDENVGTQKQISNCLFLFQQRSLQSTCSALL